MFAWFSALSAQCVGCGESALHTFGQLSDHVGLDAVVDLTSPRLTSNSSQLLGIHARFYLVKDLKNPNRLIRGPSMAWNKPPDGAYIAVFCGIVLFLMCEVVIFHGNSIIILMFLACVSNKLAS